MPKVRARRATAQVAPEEPGYELVGAVHESAHAVAAHVLGYLVSEVSIVPNEEPGEGGHTGIEFHERRSRETDRMIVWMAGFYASQTADPEVDPASAADDWQKATAAAWRVGGSEKKMLLAWRRAEELTLAFLRIEQHWEPIRAVTEVLLKKHRIRYPMVQRIIDRHLASKPRDTMLRRLTEHEKTWARYMRTRDVTKNARPRRRA